jgi:hypothetical protein
MASKAAHGVLKPEQSKEIRPPESRASHVGRFAPIAFHKPSSFQYEKLDAPFEMPAPLEDETR